MIGYPSGQDDNILLAQDYPVFCNSPFPESHIIKFFIDQACSIKMAGCWPHSSFFASLWTLTSSRSINNQKRTWPISSYLDQTSLVNNPSNIARSVNLCLPNHLSVRRSFDLRLRRKGWGGGEDKCDALRGSEKKRTKEVTDQLTFTDSPRSTKS